MTEESENNMVDLATELTIAWLGNPSTRVSAEEVPTFLRTMHTAVSALATGTKGAGEAVSEAAGSEQYMPAITGESPWHHPTTSFP